jgi:hypothetical protein
MPFTVHLAETKASSEAWYRDRETLAYIAFRYLPVLLVLNLAWEWAHVRLYTIWNDADIVYLAFSVAHCTLGDVLVAASALALALLLGRERGVRTWKQRRIAVLAALFGTAYTMFSEWMNVTIFGSWTYTEQMPTLALGDFKIGLTPVAQWIILPPLGLYLANRAGRRTGTR